MRKRKKEKAGAASEVLEMTQTVGIDQKEINHETGYSEVNEEQQLKSNEQRLQAFEVTDGVTSAREGEP